MAVVMVSELPGVDASFAEAAREMGILDEMVVAPGFVRHPSGATSSGTGSLRCGNRVTRGRLGSTATLRRSFRQVWNRRRPR